MEKSRWLDFLSARLKSQISLETAEKAEAWAVALLGLASLGGALGTMSQLRGETFIGQTEILFLLLFYAVLIFGVHLVGLLQKGEKPMARLLGVRDFTGLTVASLAVTFYSLVIFMLSHQVATTAEAMGGSKFFVFVAWMNDLVAFIQMLGCVFFIASLFFFPQLIAKGLEQGAKIRYSFLGTHIALFLLLGFGYLEMVPLGSLDFFDQLRVAGLFWIFVGSSLLLIGKLLRPTAVPALAALELDVASARLERPDDILARFKEAFVSRRLMAWRGRLSHSLAAETEKIARFSHEAIEIVSRENPAEIDLNQVEDRYRRSEALHRRLEKENQRFLLSLWLFDLNESGRAKVEELRDQFSRDLRNTKIEIASVRKRIDEKLLSLKNRMTVPPVSPAPSHAPSEPTPASLKS